MVTRLPYVAEVFSAQEIGRAAGTSTADAEALLASGAISTSDGVFVEPEEAVRAVLLLRGLEAGAAKPRQLFRPPADRRTRRVVPLTSAGLVHLGALGLLLLTTLGVAHRVQVEPKSTPPRLVFLVKPGPGGGGGGGGMRQPAPARPALLKGASKLKSPVPIERVVRRPEPPPEPKRPTPPPPPEVKPVERPIEPPPPVAKPDPVPPVVAPVVSAPAEQRDQAGVLSENAKPSSSQGPGAGGGSGTGSGHGIGEGTGLGIGPGSGGGTGGGPYRPGSGISAPELVHEVRPDYTEEARRRGLSGEVVTRHRRAERRPGGNGSCAAGAWCRTRPTSGRRRASVALLASSSARHASRRHGRSSCRIQTAIGDTMDSMLLGVVVVALALAIVMSGIVIKLLADERRRSAARVAMLASLAADASSAGSTVSDDLMLRHIIPGMSSGEPAMSSRAPAMSSRAPDMSLRAPDMSSGVPSVSSGELFAIPAQRSAWPRRLGAVAGIALLMFAIGVAVRSVRWVGALSNTSQVTPNVSAHGSTSLLDLLSLRHAQEDNVLTITGLVQNPREGRRSRTSSPQRFSSAPTARFSRVAVRRSTSRSSIPARRQASSSMCPSRFR